MARLYLRRSIGTILKFVGKFKTLSKGLDTTSFSLLLILCVCLFSWSATVYCDTNINMLRSMKSSFIQETDPPADNTNGVFMLEFEGTQPIEYESTFVEAKAGKPQRFFMDISNSHNNIDLAEATVLPMSTFDPDKIKLSHPIPLRDLLGAPEFPVSRIVVAQHSLEPPVTRVVFHLRRLIDPLTEANENTLVVKIPVGDNQTAEKIDIQPAAAESAEMVEEDDNKQVVTEVEDSQVEESILPHIGKDAALPAQNLAAEEDEEQAEEKQTETEGNESELDTPATEPTPQDPDPPVRADRPAIISDVKPIYLAKNTKLDITSDKPLRIKQVKLSKGGILRVEIFNATTSLPSSINIDKGILRAVAFESEDDELRIFINLTEPVIYEVESKDKGIVVIFDNPILEQLVSLDVNEESISTVLLMLFTQYGANIVAGSDVSGKVTAHLVDVPLKDALDKILQAEGYGYIEEDGLIRVMTAAEAEVAKASKKKEEVVIEKAPVSTLTETKVFELRYAKAADIQTLLDKLIGSKGSVITDQRTNSIILIADEEGIKQAEEIINKLDKEVKSETVKAEEEAKALEKKKQEEAAVSKIVKKVFKLQYVDPDKAGAIITPLLSQEGTVEVIKEADTRQQSSGQTSGGGGAGGGIGSAGSGLQLGEPVGRGGYVVVSDKEEIMSQIEEEIARIDKPIPQVEIKAYIMEGTLSDDTELGIDWTAISAEDDASLSFSRDFGAVITKGIIPMDKFTGILTALTNRSDVRVLSNPSITTLEGQPAMFHSGDKIPYSKVFIQDGIEQVDTVFEEVGIVLAATPYVKNDNLISLVISTSVSSEGGFTPAGQPRIATRTTRNQVIVRSGDTVAIAGLIADRSSIVVSKVPFIGDIPLVGRLFSTESEVNQKNEVTIFITPSIVP
jgi:type II secretory pathway component GspD/PulD (secretin)